VGPTGAGGGWPATFEDVAAAIDRLSDLDAPLSLDRVVVVGHSAGGQLALWAAGRGALPDDAPGARPRVRLIAAASLAGVNDLAGAYDATPGGGAVQALMGCGPAACPERYALADPIRRVPLDAPVLLVHGTADATVSVQRSRDYSRAAEQAGANVRLVELAGAEGAHRRHIDPASEGWKLTRGWLAPWRQHRQSPIGANPVAS